MQPRFKEGTGSVGIRGLWGGLVLAALVALWHWTPGPVCGAVGGGSNTTTTFTTSTTHHTTYTRVDLEDLQADRTRIIAELDELPAIPIVYDQTFSDSPSSATVQAGILAAKAALEAAAAPRTVTFIGPTFVASAVNSNTVHTGDVLDHTTQTVSTTTSFGPGTILIGDDQSQTFFVQAGTININTNTHTESFVNQLYQTTVYHEATYPLDGEVEAVSIPTLSEWAQIGMVALLIGGGLLAIRRQTKG